MKAECTYMKLGLPETVSFVYTNREDLVNQLIEFATLRNLNVAHCTVKQVE